MMCWNYDKTPWEEFPDMSISLLSSVSNSKEFRIKIPPQVCEVLQKYEKDINRKSYLICFYLQAL